MGILRLAANTSLNGYVNDAAGSFEWASPDQCPSRSGGHRALPKGVRLDP